MDNGFGCYRGSPEGIADTVEEWFASTRAKGSMLERMRDIQRIGCGEAGRDA
jgi:hypothetical protein